MYPILKISELFAIPTYLLIISLDCILILLISNKRLGSERFAYLNLKTGLDLSLIILISGLIGGRLGHILFEYPQIYLSNPLQIFNIFHGGFVFYGGLIFAVFSSIIFLKFKKDTFLKWADFFSPLIALGYSVGRLGCFLAGCCYGKPVNTSIIPWSMINHALNDGISRHPTQLYASLFELIIVAILFKFEKNKFDNHIALNSKVNLTITSSIRSKFKLSGVIFFSWLTMHGLARLFLEYFRGDFRGSLVLGTSISSVISILLILISISNLILIVKHKKTAYDYA